MKISSNVKSPKPEFNKGDKYKKHEQILMKSVVIEFIDMQKFINDVFETKNYARQFQKFIDKFNKNWKQKQFAKHIIPFIFFDPISSFKNLRYKGSSRKRALTGKEAADTLEINAARVRRRASIEAIKIAKH